jgi:integrase/recombinase XerD
LAIRVRNLILQTVKSFCQWLHQEDYLASDLSSCFQYAKVPQRLPYHVLEEKEMMALLAAPDASSLTGFRDLVMLEIFYVTGIRCGELRNLKLSHVDIEGGFLFVEQGKGGKDRVVPLTNGLAQLLSQYLTLIRPKFRYSREHDYLIPSTQKKTALSESQIERTVQAYAKKAGITKRVYPHLLRHTCATHLTRHGAPIRCVQELLGHARVDTTQVYTHVTINDLKKAHKRYHPRERAVKKDRKED